MGKTWHLVIDVALCQGCNNCVLACKDEHVGNYWAGYSRPQSLLGERWVTVPCKERGQYPLLDVVYRPTLCLHCAKPPCVARSEGALYKRADGIVLFDPGKAAGRRDLVAACPYGLIVWSEESSVPQKCTLCAHLLDDGWSEPRCVQACGPGALSMVREDDEAFAARVTAEGLVTLGGAEGTSAGVGGVVWYKNLWRFESCFIAGSVAVERAGVQDCAAGATVTLRRVASAEAAVEEAFPPAGTVVAVTHTDAFGDFKFDGLEPGSGGYEVEVQVEGQQPYRLRTDLETSLTLDTIVVGGGGR